MSFDFGFFQDAALTTPLASLAFVGSANVGAASVVQTVYFGSPTAGMKVQATSNPGVDQISVSVTESAPAAGHPTTDIKLATTSGGLATATAGAALNLGTSLQSGVANAVPIWVQLTDSTHAIQSHDTELGLTLNGLTESTYP